VITDHTLNVCEHDIAHKRLWEFYQIYHFEAIGDKKNELIRLLKPKGQESTSRRDRIWSNHLFKNRTFSRRHTIPVDCSPARTT